MKFTEFLKRVDDTFINHQASRSDGKISAANQWRYGQTLMNVLWDVWPEKYNEIKDSDINCFYSNRTVAMVINKLEKEWNDTTVEEVCGNVRAVTSSQFLDEMIKQFPSGSFVPYAYYNADMDSIQVYFKDESSYTQPLNQNVEIHLSHDTDEITGATILNIKQLIEGKR